MIGLEHIGPEEDAGDDAFEPADTAPPDAGGDATTSASPWCQTHGDGSVFCADFDEPDALGGFQLDASPSATVSIDDAQASSPPNALRTTLSTASAYTVAVALRSFAAGQSGTVTISFLARVDPSCGSQAATPTDFLVNVWMGGAWAPGIVISRYFDGGYTYGSGRVQPGGTASWQYDLAPVRAGEWQHVQLSLDLAAKTMNDQVDDASSTYDFSAAFGDAAVPATLTLALGQNTHDFQCTIDFDDLRVTEP